MQEFNDSDVVHLTEKQKEILKQMGAASIKITETEMMKTFEKIVPAEGEKAPVVNHVDLTERIYSNLMAKLHETYEKNNWYPEMDRMLEEKRIREGLPATGEAPFRFNHPETRKAAVQNALPEIKTLLKTAAEDLNLHTRDIPMNVGGKTVLVPHYSQDKKELMEYKPPAGGAVHRVVQRKII